MKSVTKSLKDWKKHSFLVRLIQLGLYEQAEIMSTELYAYRCIDKVTPIMPIGTLKVVHTINHDGYERPYLIFAV